MWEVREGFDTKSVGTRSLQTHCMLTSLAGTNLVGVAARVSLLRTCSWAKEFVGPF